MLESRLPRELPTPELRSGDTNCDIVSSDSRQSYKSPRGEPTQGRHVC